MTDDWFEQYKQCRSDASKHQADWRTESRENYDFVSGDQWDDDDRARLEETQRACVTFNRVAPVIDSIVGYEINNRRVTKYLPRGLADSQLVETMNAAAAWVLGRCMAEDEENDAFRDMLITGMGWIETRIDEDLDANGRIVMERVSPLEMRWDTSSRKSNLEDANWLMRETWLDLDDVESRWPEAAEKILLNVDDMGDQHWSGTHNATEAWKYDEDARGQWYDQSENRVLVSQYQWRERATVVDVGDPETGRVVTFELARWNRIKDRVNVPARERSEWRYYQAIISGSTVLEETDLDGFSFRAMTAKREEQTGIWYGLVRAMKSPQAWANVFFSTAMSAMQANSKGGLMIEESATNDMRELEDKWADPSGIITFADGALTGGAVREKGFGGYPPSLDNLMAFSVNAIRDVSGVNMELLGMADTASNAAQLEVERKQSALTILAPFFGAMKRYRKAQGEDLMRLMKEHLTPGQVMRITDSDPAVWWQDPGAMDFDVVVADAESSPNVKNLAWTSLQNILPAAMRAGMPVPPDVIKLSPLPDAISQRWLEYIEQQQQQPDMGQIQQQAEQMMGEMQKLQEENMQLKDKRQAQAMQIEARQQEAVLEARIKEQQMALDAKAREMELTYKMKMSDADRAAKLIEIEARYDTEMSRIREQTQMQREVALIQVDSQREQAVVSLEVERERRQQERADKMNDSVNPHIDKIEETSTEVEKMASEWNEHREEMRQQREMVLAYLQQRGGEVGELARKLSK